MISSGEKESETQESRKGDFLFLISCFPDSFLASVKPKPLKISSVTIGGGKPAFILGPCVIESEKFVWRMARKIAEACASENVDFIFKASYDKANRTSVRSFRGIGVREGC